MKDSARKAMFAKARNKFYNIEIHNNETGYTGGKFVEAPNPEYIFKNEKEFVGDGVDILRVSKELKARNMSDLVDRFNRKNGIEVCNGVRYYKDHKDCSMCKNHFKH